MYFFKVKLGCLLHPIGIILPYVYIPLLVNITSFDAFISLLKVSFFSYGKYYCSINGETFSFILRPVSCIQCEQ